MGELIRVEKLYKYFSTHKGLLHAVDGVSFSIDAGTTLGVVGESGCGKSTLGRVILGLLDATGGKIFYNGEDITTAKGKRRKDLRKEMQIIFQDPFSSLDPRMTVRDLIAEPLQNLKLYNNKKDMYARVEELMETVGLAERFVMSYPHELDGGRRQRIGVARAIAMQPKFIVCDEPVSALDVSIQAQILNLLMDLQDNIGLTYMFITHDLSVVKHISTNIMVMYLGCVMEFCRKEELFEHPMHPYTHGLLSAIPIPSIHQQNKRVLLKGELTSPINPKPGCRFAPRCAYATEECFSKVPELRITRPDHYVACHHVEMIDAENHKRAWTRE